MNRISTARLTRVALAILLALTLAGLLTGCNKKASSSTAPAGATAMSNVKIAQSALSTTAPDAKLLLVQTANVVTTTSTPVWQYLFGSPKNGSIFAVTVKDGKVAATQPYGSAGMAAAEWKAVPDASEWKIDSDAALKSALAFNKANNDKMPWAMGFVTYVPKSAATSATIDAFTWSVSFDPQGTLGKPTASINVDAKTGVASASKPATK